MNQFYIDPKTKVSDNIPNLMDNFVKLRKLRKCWYVSLQGKPGVFIKVVEYSTLHKKLLDVFTYVPGSISQETLEQMGFKFQE